jgi:hypothetical protein
LIGTICGLLLVIGDLTHKSGFTSAGTWLFFLGFLTVFVYQVISKKIE